jgi:caffeoyl-CoA O-methyltransferase
MEFARPEYAKSMYPYMLKLLPKRHEVLLEMETLARENRFPAIGPLVGHYVLQQARLIGAQRIFEMGSGFGYSAGWFTQIPGAHVTCTDGSPDNRDLAEGFLTRLDVWDRIDFKVGRAQDYLKQAEGLFDLIFCDIDKEQYPEAFDLALTRVRRGGLIIFDNVCWSGYAWEELPANAPDYLLKMTPGVRQLNKKMYDCDQVHVSINPIRDGVAVILKLTD